MLVLHVSNTLLLIIVISVIGFGVFIYFWHTRDLIKDDNMTNSLDKNLERVFVMEIKRQCAFALIAANDINLALDKLAFDKNEIDRIWYSIQSFLVATGNLSKMFWPSESKKPRGLYLRSIFKLKDDSPIAPRKFRNHFEHFDERLEHWASSSKRKNFVDSNVGPPGMIKGIDVKDYLRNFDNSNCAVTYRGDSYSLSPVIEAIKEVHSIVVKL